MSLLHGVLHRISVLLRGEDYASELAREQQFHRELEALAHTSEGRAPVDAEIAARRAFGNVTYYREEARRMTPLDWVDRIGQDVRYAWRGFRRSPGFTAAVVATLGLGLGVNAALFSLVDRVFVRAPLGVSAPKQVRRIYAFDPARTSSAGGRFVIPFFNYPTFRRLRDVDPTLAAFTPSESVSVANGAGARIAARASYVTRSYFTVLGVAPTIGRFLTLDDDRIEQDSRAAVISDAFWRRDFAADSAILGHDVIIRKHPYTIVGIAGAGFSGIDLNRADVWLPLNTFPGRTNQNQRWYDGFGNYLRLVARRRDATAETRALAPMTVAYRAAQETFKRVDTTTTVVTGPLAEAAGPADSQQEIRIATRLAAVALIVLLIACANVANLLLVRASRRQHEMAIRRALGVSASRLYGQLVTESLLLALLGGIAAVFFAMWGGGAIRALLLPRIHWAETAMDMRVVAFTLAAALVAGVMAGLAPAFNARRLDIIRSLKVGSSDSYRSRLRNALLVAQAGLSIVLLVGSGLFIRSLQKVHNIDLGYDAERLVVATPTFENDDPFAVSVGAALDEIAPRASTLPGVVQVAVTNSSPMSSTSGSKVFLPDRDSLPKFGPTDYPTSVAGSPNYFDVVGLRVVLGRVLTASDKQSVVVSEAMARVFWPGENAIGKCIILVKRANPCLSVVGVAEDVKNWRVTEQPALKYYVPLGAQGALQARFIVARVEPGGAAQLSRYLRAEFPRSIPGATGANVALLGDYLAPQYRPWRLGATLFTAMGVLALIVAAIGVYSVIAYTVSQRTREMGVRIALGGTLRDIVQLVVGEGMRVIALGVFLGVVVALAAGRFVASLLYGISPRDPVVLVAAAVILGTIGVLAALVPAWRAARVDPVTALRAE